MKLIIADDHTLFRETLGEHAKRHFPDANIQVSEDFHGVLDIMKVAPEQDLVLLDLRMPGMDGINGFLKMKELYPETKVALMSGLAEPFDVRAAIDAGAIGYFPKTLSGKSFVKGIRQIMAGESFVPVNTTTNQVMQSYKADHHHDNTATGNGNEALREDQSGYTTISDYRLTNREKDVLSCLLKGHANKQIATDLEIQEVTVKLHVRGICSKLGATNRTQAALKARELGLG